MSDIPDPGPGGPAPAPGDPDLPTPPVPVPEPVPEPDPAPFDPRMLEALVCPQTHGVLSWDPGRRELVSRAAHLAYPVRDGIPIMLASEARALD